MGTIIFEEGPPYDRLVAKSLTANATREGVELELRIVVDWPHFPTVPVRVLLQPSDVLAVGPQMIQHAKTVQHWNKHPYP